MRALLRVGEKMPEVAVSVTVAVAPKAKGQPSNLLVFGQRGRLETVSHIHLVDVGAGDFVRCNQTLHPSRETRQCGDSDIDGIIQVSVDQHRGDGGDGSSLGLRRVMTM